MSEQRRPLKLTELLRSNHPCVRTALEISWVMRQRKEPERAEVVLDPGDADVHC